MILVPEESLIKVSLYKTAFALKELYGPDLKDRARTHGRDRKTVNKPAKCGVWTIKGSAENLKYNIHA